MKKGEEPPSKVSAEEEEGDLETNGVSYLIVRKRRRRTRLISAAMTPAPPPTTTGPTEDPPPARQYARRRRSSVPASQTSRTRSHRASQTAWLRGSRQSQTIEAKVVEACPRPQRSLALEHAPTGLYKAAKAKPEAAPLDEFLARPGANDGEPGPTRRRRWSVLLPAVIGIICLGAVALAFLGRAPLPPPRPPAPGPATVKPESPAPVDAAHAAWPHRDLSHEAETETETETASGDSPTRVKFKTRNQMVLVPVRLQGRAGMVGTQMVFDTGATFSMVTADLAARLGSRPGEARYRVRTVSGVERVKLIVVESVVLGGAKLEGGVTMGVCTTCRWNLLGLNFARQFVVTVDYEQGELVLRPKRLQSPKLFDLQPFITFQGARVENKGGKVWVATRVFNGSPRAVSSLEVAAMGPESQVLGQIDLPYLAPGASSTVSIPLPEDAARRVHLSLRNGRW